MAEENPMLTKLKILCGITNNDSDSLLQLLLGTVVDKVLADTRQPYLPKRAESLVVEMAFDAYGLWKQAQSGDAGEIVGSISSVSDNGQSVGYRDSSNVGVLKAVAEGFLKNYEDRLAPFRMPGW